MPEFRQASETVVEERGEGWTLSAIADARHVPGMAMAAMRWDLEPGAVSPERPASQGAERFLYVIAGAGFLRTSEERLAVGLEDMVWLQPDDRFALEAAGEPLSVLEATSSQETG